MAGEITTGDALVRLQSWHVAVAKAGAAILAQYKGQLIPCEVRSRHNAAVSEYLRAARSVFSQLQKQGVPTTQKIVDVTGKERIIRPSAANPFPTPVPPLTFVVGDCKGVDQGMGNPIALVLLASAIVTVILVAGHAVAIRIAWPGGPPAPYAEVADNYMKCIQANKDPRLCAGLEPKQNIDWLSWGLVGSMLIATVAGGVFLWKKFSRDDDGDGDDGGGQVGGRYGYAREPEQLEEAS